jgi:hypothetical protein
MKATGRILHIDFSQPVSARKVRPGLITRESFHIHGSSPLEKAPIRLRTTLRLGL